MKDASTGNPLTAETLSASFHFSDPSDKYFTEVF
jgi:hypothetical protein